MKLHENRPLFRQAIRFTADQMLLPAIVLQLKSISASDLYENIKTFLKTFNRHYLQKRNPQLTRHLHSTQILRFLHRRRILRKIKINEPTQQSHTI